MRRGAAKCSSKIESDRSATSRLSERTFSSSSLGRSSIVDYQEDSPSHKPIKSPGAPLERIVFLATIKNVIGRIQTGAISLAVGPFTGGFGIHNAHISPSTMPKPSPLLKALGWQWPKAEIANGPTKSPRRLAIGGIGFIPRAADTWTPQFLTARSSYTDDRLERSLRAPPPPSEEEDRLADKTYQTGRDAPSSAPSYQPQQGKTSSAATVHIDGSALGRWTIQHLERALGKPATGMTGVDPRASPPRSRVSPF